MIYGPHLTHLSRLQPVDKDRQDDGQDPSKKKKGLYQGRSWAETDEKLPVQPKKQENTISQKRSLVMYADRLLLEKAKKLFEKMTTLEEKVAQLFFLETEAIYDTEAQLAIELLLQAWQVGGIIFKKGEYRRQLYLIDRFQEISKTPLLFANDFLHGLSFYLQGDSLKSGLSSQHFNDLGKAVMVQNRRMGVYVQLERERKALKTSMTELQAKAFRKGIREAGGIVGKQKCEKLNDNFSHTFKNAHPYFLKESDLLSPTLPEANIQEAVGYKVLTFFDVSFGEGTQENILDAYRDHYDIFLVSKESADAAIRHLCNLIKFGKISEEDLDRRVMKVLIIKTLHSSQKAQSK